MRGGGVIFDDLRLKNDKKFHQRQFFLSVLILFSPKMYLFSSKISFIYERKCTPLTNCTVQDTIRCTVLEMWNQGEKLACGLVTQDTKVWRPLQ